MSNTNKTIVSQAAVAYAKTELTPIIEKLNSLSENATTQNKLLAYHVFETCLLAEGEKVTHAMLEAAIDKPFDKRVSAKGRKVADYVMNKKPAKDGVIYTASQFRASTKDNGEVIVPAELHVMTVYGHIAAYEKAQRETKADTKSVVEQALAAAGLPVELADKQIKLAQDGNDAAMSFVKSAMEKFTPVKAEKTETSESLSPQDILTAALDVLISMTTEGNEDAARDWLAQTVELLGFGPEGESETETELAQVA